MKIINITILVFILFLSFASGIPKIILMSQEVSFFGKIGFSEPLLIGFGILHVIGGIALAVPKTRVLGAWFMTVIFALSALLIFKMGNIPFGLFSLVPALLSIVIAKTS